MTTCNFHSKNNISLVNFIPNIYKLKELNDKVMNNKINDELCKLEIEEIFKEWQFHKINYDIMNTYDVKCFKSRSFDNLEELKQKIDNKHSLTYIKKENDVEIYPQRCNYKGFSMFYVADSLFSCLKEIEKSNKKFVAIGKWINHLFCNISCVGVNLSKYIYDCEMCNHNISLSNKLSEIFTESNEIIYKLSAGITNYLINGPTNIYNDKYFDGILYPSIATKINNFKNMNICFTPNFTKRNLEFDSGRIIEIINYSPTEIELKIIGKIVMNINKKIELSTIMNMKTNKNKFVRPVPLETPLIIENIDPVHIILKNENITKCDHNNFNFINDRSLFIDKIKYEQHKVSYVT